MKSNGKKKIKELPVLQDGVNGNYEGYDVILLISETARLGNLITKRGTLKILIPLCCTTKPIRHKQFRP
jgi:hypothetical protein